MAKLAFGIMLSGIVLLIAASLLRQYIFQQQPIALQRSRAAEQLQQQVMNQDTQPTECDGKVYTDISEALLHSETVCQVALNFTGLTTIPSQLFLLPHLKQLDIMGNQLTALDGSIARFDTLEVLNLMDNEHLETLPEEIGQLQHLRELHLGGTGMSTLPDGFAKLTQLEFLDIMDTGITKIPGLENMHQLRQIDLEETDSSAIVPILPFLPSLEVINLRFAKVPELFPENWSALEQLTTINLEHTTVTTVPESLQNLPQLNHCVGCGF